MENVLSTILIAYGDLGSSCYVFHGTAPQLSSLEEDVGIFITTVIDEGNHEVEAGPVLDFYLWRADREGIGGNL